MPQTRKESGTTIIRSLDEGEVDSDDTYMDFIPSELNDDWGSLDIDTLLSDPGTKESARFSVGKTQKRKTGATYDRAVLNSDDTLNLYLNQMGRLPLLTEAQEIELAQKIERGQEAENLLQQTNEVLEPERRVTLNQQQALGKIARDYFIEANTRLVVSQAKKYQGRGLSLQDLIQAGNIGLIKAVDRFDYRHGNRFSTYAVWWIRQSIFRALTEHGHGIRLPSNMRRRLRKLHRAIKKLEQNLHRQPVPEEIASVLENEDTQDVRYLIRVGQKTVSLNTPVGEDENTELLHLIEDDDAPTVFQQVQTNQMRVNLASNMRKALTPREFDIVRRRFGMDNREPETLKYISERLGISRERVRQIERQALRKLRRPAIWRKLRNYLRGVHKCHLRENTDHVRNLPGGQVPDIVGQHRNLNSENTQKQKCGDIGKPL